MSSTIALHTFQITIVPSPETNDHQVRFLIDQKDIIRQYWNDMLGLDPDQMLIEPCPLRADTTSKTITLARCSCGVVGCDDRAIEIARAGEHIVWRFGTRPAARLEQRLHFDVVAYNAEIERAIHDTSWETPERTAARLLATTLPQDKLAQSGLTYDWASGRIRNETLTVSLTHIPGPYQILIHIPWKGESPSEIATMAADILGKAPNTWRDVQWHRLAPHLNVPTIIGPNW